MGKVSFQDFDSFHEATCAALFTKYGWKWERLSILSGWFPDFTLRGNVLLNVKAVCNGAKFRFSLKYEDAVSGTSAEVLLIPSAPRRVKNTRDFDTSILGFLFDGNIWSYAELGRWSGKVGFCHSGNSWNDRISGQNVKSSSGDGQLLILNHWRAAFKRQENNLL